MAIISYNPNYEIKCFYKIIVVEGTDDTVKRYKINITS